jgi:predicted peroxiredoxin
MNKNILSRPRTLFAGLLVMLTMIVSPLAMADNCNGNNGSQNIVVHLKRQIEDLQGAITGVRLATLMQSKGCNVTVFLTLGGVRIADDRMPQALAFGVNTMAPTLQQAVSAFQGLGGTIAVCPACAEEIGLEEDDLIPGAEIIGPDAIADLFMDADKILDF